MAGSKSDGRGVELVVGSVPIALRAHGPHVVRVSLGSRPVGAPSSYLNAQTEEALSTFVPGASPTSVRLGELSVEINVSKNELVFNDSAGRRQLRMATDRLALTPRARLMLGTTGEQHFYGLGEGGQQFDRLAVTRRLWNFQANRGQGADISVPLSVGTAASGISSSNPHCFLIPPPPSSGCMTNIFTFSAMNTLYCMRNRRSSRKRSAMAISSITPTRANRPVQ